MRYFIYCRKSSEAEDRQVASIESQLATLQRTFGENPDIHIIGVYEEAFSAKAPGRVQFGAMLSQIEKGKADGIIAWAPDRLARNSIDGGQVVYMLDRGIIRDLKFATYTFENNSQGKFMLQIMFGQSKYYSDALSDNVKRGNRSKIEKGWRPNKPPLGYRNDPATRTIVKDAERFCRIRQMFDLMLSRAYTPRGIWELARHDWDLRTPRRRHMGGRPIPLSYVYKILSNPFYAGILVWNGRHYPGAHEPVVSMQEFEAVQSILRTGERPRPVRAFAFTGMIRCGECGLMVTAEDKVNRHGSRYTYYHCTKRREESRCRQPSITKYGLEEQIEQFLRRVTLPSDLHEWVVERQNHSADADENMRKERQKALQVRLKRTQLGLETLVSLRVRDLITDEQLVKERNALVTERTRIEQDLERAQKSVDTFEPFEALVSFSSRAVCWFRDGDDDTKRLVFKVVGSNPVLKDKKLSVEAKKPFRLRLDSPHFLKQRAVWNHVRKLVVENDPELQETLQGIRKLEEKLGIIREKPPRWRRPVA